MGSAYGNADLVVARSGALTIGELIAVGLPSILIPYPYSAGGHQFTNARFLEKRGAAVVILEKNLNAELLATKIKELLTDKTLYANMKSAIMDFNVLDSASLIADRVMRYVNNV
jgi:UDP-N-acetylglucosamine--N-acetylmuramyl-(pentapeptide) pyrophosphoryl-undecaprenol N-acetylglucosamine transferase